MSLLELSIWLILLVIFSVINLRIAFGDIMGAKRGESFSTMGFLWNFLAGLLCIYSSYVAVDKIVEYQEDPEVYTTVEPEVKTIQHGGKTIYIYRFQDNTWPELY